MSLTTGSRLRRYSWDRIPMPQTVIKRVEDLAHGEPEHFVFTDRKGRLIGEIEITGVDNENNADANQNELENFAPIE